jgi:hypothetical protein
MEIKPRKEFANRNRGTSLSRMLWSSRAGYRILARETSVL